MTPYPARVKDQFLRVLVLGDGLCSASRGDGVNVYVWGCHVSRVTERKVSILL